MSHNWQGTRASELPPNWAELRDLVKLRALDQCEATINGHRCPNMGTECHHAGDKHDHRIESLQWLCHECHDTETQRQALEASLVIRARAKHPRHRLRYLTQRVGATRAQELLRRI